MIHISWYDELFFIIKRFRVTVDTTYTYMYAYTLSPSPSSLPPPSLTHTHTHTPSELDHGLSEPQIRCIAKQMFSALGFLHESGCIHRDLKAGNILLMPNGSIRLGGWILSLSVSISHLSLPLIVCNICFSRLRCVCQGPGQGKA